MSDLIDREEAVALAIDHFSADVDDRASMVAALRALPAVAPWAEEELISALTRTELNRYHAERIARVVLSRPSPVREPDEAQPTAYCCHCGARPITDGSELACGCWTCSAKCWEAEVGPDDVPDCHSCPTTLASERRRAPDYEAGSRVLRDELYTQPNTHALARAIIDAAITGARVEVEDVRDVSSFIETHQRCYELSGGCGAESFVTDAARRILAAIGEGK